ncbi:5'-methylthioadenosine/S-adenosylhomocysteine nucleosidase [Schaalia sp. lx-260]|uniref:5'-methylthioadenosine/S-adenosylhomocysteine nucleosidase n=1 Tax=Schaalia sp. lx-260 TaxID=2899082 RepID=UPI001E513099|nr:5'-methylthioadenosine/S-adenosylhomocysteine nucleosidase [Schaalia sp. lx-260]MCD4550047.1 5'-methylthioadenosine/S-adenosylhomocysteine nucleosidase [Schaalia sp. lx-260]
MNATHSATEHRAHTLPELPERIRVRAVIQCAMDMEAEPVLSALDPQSPQKTLVIGNDDAHQQIFTLGTLEGHSVLVVTSGIGLANSAAATARALTLVQPDIVIAAGTTGGLHKDIRVGDIAVGVRTVYSCADATVFGYERGQIPRMPADYRSSERAQEALNTLSDHIEYQVMVGDIVSSDSFMNGDIVDIVRADFPNAMASDMETTAMAQVAWSCGSDWVSLRAVSDLCGPSAGDDFRMDGQKAAQHSAEAVRAYLSLY